MRTYLVESYLVDRADALLAGHAVAEAVARNGDQAEIDQAEAALAEGDVERAGGRFKNAVAKYKDATAKADGA